MKKIIISVCALYAAESCAMDDLAKFPCAKTELVENLKNEFMMLDLQIVAQDKLAQSFQKEGLLVSNILDFNESPYITKEMHAGFQIIEDESATNLEIVQNITTELREKRNTILQRIELLEPSVMQHLQAIRSPLLREIKKGVGLKSLSVKSGNVGTREIPYLLLLDAIKRNPRTALSPDMLYDLETKYGSKSTLIEKLKNEVMALDLEIADQELHRSIIVLFDIDGNHEDPTNLPELCQKKNAILQRIQRLDPSEMQHLQVIRSPLLKEIKKGVNLDSASVKSGNAGIREMPYLLLLDTIKRSTRTALSSEMLCDLEARCSSKSTLVENLKNEVMTLDLQIADQEELARSFEEEYRLLLYENASAAAEANVGVTETNAAAIVETQAETTTAVSAEAVAEASADTTMATNVGAAAEASTTAETNMANTVLAKKEKLINGQRLVTELREKKNAMRERIELLDPSEMQHLKSVRSQLLKEIKNQKRIEYFAILCDLEGSNASIPETPYINALNAIKNGERTTYTPAMLDDLDARYDSKVTLLIESLKSQVMMLTLHIEDQEELAETLDKEMRIFKDILDPDDLSESFRGAAGMCTALEMIETKNALNLENVKKVIQKLHEKKHAMVERIELLDPSEIQHLKPVRSQLLKEIKEGVNLKSLLVKADDVITPKTPYINMLNAIKTGKRTTYSSEMLDDLEGRYDSKAALLMENLKSQVVMLAIHISDQEKLVQSLEKELSLISNILNPNRGSSYTRDEMNAVLEMTQAEKDHNGESPFDVLARLMHQKKSQREEVKKAIKELAKKQNMTVERIKILDPSEMQHLKAARAELLIAIKNGVKLKSLPVITDDAIAQEIPYILLLNAIKDRKQTTYSPEMLCDLEARYDAKPTLVENLKNKIMMLELQILDKEGLAQYHEKKYRYYLNESALSDALISIVQQKKLDLENTKEVLKELNEKKNAMLERVELLDPSEKQHLKRALLPLLKSIRQGVKRKSISVRIAREVPHDLLQNAQHKNESAENDDIDTFSGSTDSEMSAFVIQDYFGSFNNKQDVSVHDEIKQDYVFVEQQGFSTDN